MLNTYREHNIQHNLNTMTTNITLFKHFDNKYYSKYNDLKLLQSLLTRSSKFK